MRLAGIAFWGDDRRPFSYLGAGRDWTAPRSGARFTACRGRLDCVALRIVMDRVFTIFAIGLPWKLWSNGIGLAKTWSAACQFCRPSWDTFTWLTPTGI
jgi:hypothetical protein